MRKAFKGPKKHLFCLLGNIQHTNKILYALERPASSHAILSKIKLSERGYQDAAISAPHIPLPALAIHKRA